MRELRAEAECTYEYKVSLLSPDHAGCEAMGLGMSECIEQQLQHNERGWRIAHLVPCESVGWIVIWEREH